MPSPTLASVQAYIDARRVGSLHDAIGCTLWELPGDVADELRVLCSEVGPIGGADIQ